MGFGGRGGGAGRPFGRWGGVAAKKNPGFVPKKQGGQRDKKPRGGGGDTKGGGEGGAPPPAPPPPAKPRPPIGGPTRLAGAAVSGVGGEKNRGVHAVMGQNKKRRGLHCPFGPLPRDWPPGFGEENQNGKFFFFKNVFFF